MIDDIKAWIGTVVLLVSYSAVTYAGYLAGVERGRSQYHDELINELDAKGGAPVLLYPPTQTEEGS